ncbi:hypothetical protein BE20_05400 [Sorangium cellulosum]|uniref:3-oxoacyl-ACP synthase n=1 Tax=Sorangium cellulosum TaxID=56 RepID=A0A150SNC8_SORCE|nr:hypothetical protein BE18_14105 [Sorangium cellulosum]KYF94822.1 hypothetical protein BE20_05400 [Sorangium cellulosum]
MKLAVVGLGLVSPAGITSSEHVFYLRARVPPPAASPFLLAGGRRLSVGFCPWIGARERAAARIARIALTAMVEATRPLLHPARAPGLDRIALVLVAASPRPGLSRDDVREVEAALAARLGVVDPLRFRGEAGCFAGLRAAEELLAGGQARAVAIVAADSLISIERLRHWVSHPPSPWAAEVPRPSEGAAALVVTTPDAARLARLPLLGTVHGAAVVQGRSTDADDAIVDGAAMTQALRDLPRIGRVGAVFGQLQVGSLRQTEWLLALARSGERFEPEHEATCPEVEVGVVGAAAGAFNLAYGLATLRHGATESPAAAGAPMLAWAISPDGTRGVAMATGAGA